MTACGAEFTVSSIRPKRRFDCSSSLSHSLSTGPCASSLMCAVSGSSVILALALRDVGDARQRAHQLAEDGEHDLVRAAADRAQARIAIGAAHRRLVHEAHAAPILQAGVGDLT